LSVAREAGAATAVPFVDLTRGWPAVRERALDQLDALGRRGAFILGPELEEFESAWARYCMTEHCVGVSSGTSALHLALLALGIGPGDEVVTVSSTYIATIEAILDTGATPVFAEIDPQTRLVSPESLSAALTERTAAAVVVHLYGRPAPIAQLADLCRRAGIALVEDAAQAHGARVAGRRVGSWGDAGAFSFYPSKNLGALGDGGAVVTDREDVADAVRSLRTHGTVPHDLNRHVRDGTTARLDNLQAAFLMLKLPTLDAANAERRRLAAAYREALAGLPLGLPPEDPLDGEQVFHLFAVEVEDRDVVRAALTEAGIGTGVHYPLPVHLQPVWRARGHRPGELPVSERLAETILSLPLFPGLAVGEMNRVATALAGALG
jgi:dTDP-4-amino-4,6-dideoxygalactose transaminase